MKDDPSARLAREFAWALFGEAPAAGHYYVIDRGRNRTIYGPFETEKDVAYAGYFAKPVSDRDVLAAKGLIRVYFMLGVQKYGTEDLKTLLRYPGECELKSVKLKQEAPPMHSSWKALDKDFREEQRDKDYSACQPTT